jgi:2-oxoglutarate dehydrogenase E2 component (dihydrolipoamide succinyltransferase)
MSIEVKIPPLPESVSDAVVSAWHKQPGDLVAQDENLVDIETDKVVLEVPSPGAGVLEGIIELEGATVVAGQVIAKIAPVSADTAVGEERAKSESVQGAKEDSAPKEAATMSPAVRKLLHEHDLEPDTIRATGKNGRLLKEDILAYLEQQETTKPVQPKPVKKEAPMVRPAVSEPEVSPGPRAERRVPMTRLRARIAERLLSAQQDAALLTTFNEVNMQPIMDLRGRYREAFEKAHGIKLGFMSFFVRAVTEGLKRFPAINASIDGGDIVYHDYYDIGVAVSSPRGLVVPVLRDTDQASLAQIEKNIRDFAERAKTGKLDMDELTGGTFSITNGGVFGSMLSTPIINPPQSAILGMHKIVERPVAEDGQVVIRPVMYLALSYDHRLIDGREAVSFLVSVKQMLEDPARILLDV